MDDQRLVLGHLGLPDGGSVSFELRHDRWLTDDPHRLLRWHDGPLECRDGLCRLMIAKDMGAAIVLEGLDPAQASPGQRGRGRLLEAARPEHAQAALTWEIREVIVAPPV
ncbi:MAG TPA: hypothetical protein VNO84_09700 [Burkholderiaceae bacterium]|nr:hypothetical protein [Burkholderiaceae bacterium]